VRGGWLEERDRRPRGVLQAVEKARSCWGRLVLQLSSERRERERERERERFQKATTISVFPRPRQWIPTCRTWCPM
jgi:hypothetical protein